MPTLDAAIRWLAVTLEPLAASANNDDTSIAFIERLGWTLPLVPPSWTVLAGTAGSMLESFTTVIEARARTAAGDASSSNEPELQLAVDVSLVTAAVAFLGDRLRAELPTAYLDATGIADALVERLHHCLLEQFLRDHLALLHAILVTLGVIEISVEAADPARFQPAYTRVQFRWERLALALTDPARLMHDVYGWGTAVINAERLFSSLLSLSYFLAAPAEVHYPSTSELAAFHPAGSVIESAAIGEELWVPILHEGVAGYFSC